MRRAKRQILSANYVPPLGHIFFRWLRWRLALWALGLPVEAAQNRRFYRPGSFPIRIADGRAGGAAELSATPPSHPPGEWPTSANERYLLQKLSLFRVAAFFIADIGNDLILSCSSEFEYRIFRECLRSRGKVRHLRGLGGGIRSLFRAELALRRLADRQVCDRSK